MDLNTVCDDILWLILREVPVAELMPLRLICSRWCFFIDRICMWHQRSIKVLHNERDVSKLQDLLRLGLVDSFTKQLIGQNGVESKDHVVVHNRDCLPLSTVFARVNKLMIFEDLYQNTLTGIDFLLAGWTHINSLIIHGNTRVATASLNRLTQLTELHFLYISSIYFDPGSISVLSQLKHFSLIRYFGNLVPILSQLTNCTHLWLCKVLLDCNSLAQALTSNPHLASSLTHLSLGPLAVQLRDDQLKRILHLVCTHFKALTYFNAEFSFALSPAEIMTELAHLPHLTDLKLHMYFKLDDNSEESDTMAPCVTLTSVTRLQLLLYSSPISKDQFAAFFGPSFPSLTRMSVKSKRPQLLTQLEQCVFDVFPKLHRCDFPA